MFFSLSSFMSFLDSSESALFLSLACYVRYENIPRLQNSQIQHVSCSLIS